MDDLGIGPKIDAEGIPVCSPGLRKLLTEGESAFASARLISINPTLLAEARRVAPAVDEALTPLVVGDLLDLLDDQALRHPGVRSPVEDRAIFWNAYFRELQTYPLESVAQAFLAWNRGDADTKTARWSDIFPQPFQLSGFAKAHQAKLGQMRFRLQKALALVGPDHSKTTPQERQAVGEQLAALANTLTPKAIPDHLRPRLSPQQVADRLRNSAPAAPEDDVGIVL